MLHVLMQCVKMQDHHKAISWWTPVTGMGSALSAREQKDLKPHLQGIEPSSLAAVIWDSINSVGIDDEVEIFGVHFLNGTEFEDGGQARVIFWDEIGAHDMPRKVFLEILLMMGNEIAQEYEDKYDLELSIDLGIAVRKLQVALVSLRETLDGLTDDQCAKTYRERLDSGVSMNEDSISDELVEEVRTRHGSYMWTDSDQESEAAYGGRRQSKGIESVFERLPDLKRRYENAISSSNSSKKPLERVRQRIKILNMFQKGSVAPSAILEEEEHASHAPSPNPMRRRSTLGMSSVQRSRSNSVCSYDSVSSSKQLLLPDSPPPVPSMPSMRKSTPVDPQDQDSSSSSSLA